MTTKKGTKRALLTSVLALLMCLSMLVGTTFAWFTDSVTTGVNQIVSGNLDIEVYYAYPSDVVDGDIPEENWKKVDAETPVFNKDALWEPGYTEAVFFKFDNAGSLALQYQFQVDILHEILGKTKDGADIQLSNYIQAYACNSFTWNYKDYLFNDRDDATDPAGAPDPFHDTLYNAANGDVATPSGENPLSLDSWQWLEPDETTYATLVLWMPTTVGNEANHDGVNIPSIDLGISVVATQYTFEKDSFDDQYDVKAEYAVADGVYVQEDGSLKAVSQEALSEVAKLASKDETITSVTYNGAEVPVVRDTTAMNAELAEGETTIVLTEGTYTVGAAAGKTVTIAGTEDTKVDITSGLTYVRGANVTFEGLTIQSAPEGAGYTNGLADATYTVFNNCTINGTLGLDYSCEFNNCEFNIAGDYYNVWTWGAGTATFNGCTFNCDGKALLVYANVLDNGTDCQTVNVNNCVFNDNGDDTITDKAAIEIGNDYGKSYELIINKTTVNGFAVSKDSGTSQGGTNSNSNVWGNKNRMPTDKLNVVIDGVEVY